MPDPWNAEVARWPVAFAQVREDAALDRWVVEQLDEGAEVIMVASGGCTAAALASLRPVSRLHLVDPNPAQLALARLKIALAGDLDPIVRLGILGHCPMSSAERAERLEAALQALKLPADALGPLELVAKLGPDHAGRYEGLFAKLREALGPVAGELNALLQLRAPSEQSHRAAPVTPLGRALDAAFDSVMSLPNLVGLFGEGATRNRCEPFSRHFARRTRHALATMPAADNPYLWQMLRGCFPEGVAYPWLTSHAPAHGAEVVWTVAGMAEALKARGEAYDFVHLSNILDWLSPDEARATLELAWRALRPGGWTLIRQLNSNLDIQALGGRFQWQPTTAQALHARDRSFFYRSLHLGRKG